MTVMCTMPGRVGTLRAMRRAARFAIALQRATGGASAAALEERGSAVLKAAWAMTSSALRTASPSLVRELQRLAEVVERAMAV